MTRYARAVLVVFFVALLLTPVLIRRMGIQPAPARPRATPTPWRSTASA